LGRGRRRRRRGQQRRFRHHRRQPRRTAASRIYAWAAASTPDAVAPLQPQYARAHPASWRLIARALPSCASSAF